MITRPVMLTASTYTMALSIFPVGDSLAVFLVAKIDRFPSALRAETARYQYGMMVRDEFGD